MDIIAEIQELQVRRKHHIKTTNRLTNAGGALVRRALGWMPESPDAEKIKGRAASLVAAFLNNATSVEDEAVVGALAADLVVLRMQVEIAATARHAIELEMKRKARKLHAYAFAKDVKGLGELALAVIVGESGDLAKYSKHDKLWKRLGLAPYKGRAMSAWRSGGLSKPEWESLGYSPRRRAEIFAVVGDPLFRAQSGNIDKETGEVVKQPGPYRATYDVYKARQIELNESGAFAERAAELVKASKANGNTPLKANVEGRLTVGHIHNRAIRYMTKALISDLWSEWRRAEKEMAGNTPPETLVPAAELIREAA